MSQSLLQISFARLGVSRESIEKHMQAKTIERGTLLLSEGDEPDVCGLVVSGVVSEYYLKKDGTERTRAICGPGSTFGSVSDAMSQRRSSAFVRAETQADVFLTRWSAIEQLAKESREWELMRANLVQQLFLRKATREYELLMLDARGRYLSMLVNAPGIELWASQTLIASYLGITPVHLSRLRSKLRSSLARS